MARGKLSTTCPHPHARAQGLGEPGAPEANSLASPTAQLPQGRVPEPAGTLDAMHLKSYLMAKQPFGDMVVALQQHVVHHPTLRALAPALLHRFEETLGVLLPPATTLPDASGLQEQVERSGITWVKWQGGDKKATLQNRRPWHDLKGSSWNCCHPRPGPQAGRRRHKPPPAGATGTAHYRMAAALEPLAQQEHHSLPAVSPPAFPTAHTARLLSADPIRAAARKTNIAMLVFLSPLPPWATY
jgi:hypothetical protein